jgi:hypothetical protein
MWERNARRHAAAYEALSSALLSFLSVFVPSPGVYFCKM